MEENTHYDAKKRALLFTKKDVLSYLNLGCVMKQKKRGSFWVWPWKQLWKTRSLQRIMIKYGVQKRNCRNGRVFLFLFPPHSTISMLRSTYNDAKRSLEQHISLCRLSYKSNRIPMYFDKTPDWSDDDDDDPGAKTTSIKVNHLAENSIFGKVNWVLFFWWWNEFAFLLQMMIRWWGKKDNKYIQKKE